MSTSKLFGTKIFHAEFLLIISREIPPLETKEKKRKYSYKMSPLCRKRVIAVLKIYLNFLKRKGLYEIKDLKKVKNHKRVKFVPRVTTQKIGCVYRMM